MEATYSVYCHTNTINGKQYIGITKRPPQKRWGKDGVRYSGQLLGNAINKYGWENFKHEILVDGLTKEEAEKEEQRLIKEMETLCPRGYNLTSGGNLGAEFSEETKKKLRETHLGKPMPTHVKEMMSQLHRGKYVSEETRVKLSNSRKGLKESEEWRRKIGEASKGRKWTEQQRKKYLENRIYATGADAPKARRVAQFTTDGTLIAVFGCVREAELSINNNHHVSDCCLGKAKTAGGYVWKYAEEEGL